MEFKGLCVNVDKIKVMVIGAGVVSEEWPCAVCKKGVGRNSIMCCMCEGWVYMRCSGVYGRLQDMIDFECHMQRKPHD